MRSVYEVTMLSNDPILLCNVLVTPSLGTSNNDAAVCSPKTSFVKSILVIMSGWPYEDVVLEIRRLMKESKLSFDICILLDSLLRINSYDKLIPGQMMQCYCI